MPVSSPNHAAAQKRRGQRDALFIIAPVYNEANTVKQVIDRLREVPLPLAREIIVVDDGSTDATGEVLALSTGSIPGW